MCILGAAIMAGLLAGYVRARRQQQTLQLPGLTAEWFVIVAVLPQIVVFFLPSLERLASREVASIVLVASQALLLLFIWLNRSYSALLIIGTGLAMNLLVIGANGGLMPISPSTVQQLDPTLDLSQRTYGERLGGSKDQLLPESETRLALLADRIVPPDWFPVKAAYSLGDVLIALGAFLFFWQAGSSRQPAE